MDRDAPFGDEAEVFAVPVSGETEGEAQRMAVLLWNKSLRTKEITVTMEELGLSSEQAYRVRDLWTHKDWSVPVKKEVKGVIPSHGVLLVTLTPIM